MNGKCKKLPTLKINFIWKIIENFFSLEFINLSSHYLSTVKCKSYRHEKPKFTYNILAIF
jgi:hypothetical protein